MSVQCKYHVFTFETVDLVILGQTFVQTGQLFQDCILLALVLTTVTAKEVSEVNGKNLRVAAEHWPPFFIIHPVHHGFDLYFGVMEKVLESLRISLNFSTTIVRPVDRTWGEYDRKTGKWGGMIGMVHREEVDFGLGNIIYL